MGGHIARIGAIRNDAEFWCENMEGRDSSEDLGVDARIILERILRETGWEGVEWT
jgi:hypothetical protein